MLSKHPTLTLELVEPFDARLLIPGEPDALPLDDPRARAVHPELVEQATRAREAARRRAYEAEHGHTTD